MKKILYALFLAPLFLFGQEWTQLHSNTCQNIITDDNGTYYSLNSTNVTKSFDGGLTWETTNFDLNPTYGALSYDSVLLVSSPHNDVYISSNQGQSWESSFTYLDWQSSFLNGFGCEATRMIYIPEVNQILMSYTGYLRGIYKAQSNEDNNLVWEKKFSLGADCWDMCLSADIVYSAFRSSNQIGGLYKSYDYGDTWELLLNTEYADNPSVLEVSASHIYYVSVDNKFYKSDDEGATWTNSHLFTDLNDQIAPNYSCKDMVRIGNTLIASFNHIGLFKSTDNGDTWGKIDELNENQLNYMLVSDNKLFVSSQSGIYSTEIGCTDELSCNYNNIATFEDTTCIYSQDVNACASCSGESDGTGSVLSNDEDNDGICDADEQEGCKDLLACNYNQSFTVDMNNDLCIYAVDAGPCAVCSGESNGTGYVVANDDDDDGICNIDEVTCEDIFASNYSEEVVCAYYNTYPIEDIGFLNYLIENYPDCIVNDSLNLDAVGGITSLNLDGLNLFSIDGVQYFTDLISMSCNNNNLTTLPVLPDNLTILSCSGNGLTVIQVLPIGLISFTCDNNDLTVLPILPVTLTSLSCSGNALTYIESLTTELTSFTCDNNDLITLPVLPDGLIILSCSGNQLNGIEDLPSGLTILLCNDNNLISLPTLPVSLITISCYGNGILIVNDLPIGLIELNVTDNPIICVGSYPLGLSSELSDYLPCQYGCMDQLACNYDNSALVTDSNCIYPFEFYNCNGVCDNDLDGDGYCDQLEIFGCTDTIADNYDTLATENTGCIIDIGCAVEGACNYSTYVVNNNFDLCMFPPYYYLCVEVVSLTDGTITYEFECNSDGDGDGICDELEVYGCIQVNACNYNPESTEDNNDCIFPELNYDCVGNCLIDMDADGVCDIDEVIGCQDQTACNYNELATDQGFCNYPLTYFDCTGSCLADIDGDGICDSLEIVGCQDEIACNYDVTATDDSGLCGYAVENYDCNNLCLNDVDSDSICDEYEVVGCQDVMACNYHELATDEGICDYAATYFDCNGACLADTDIDGVCDELEIYGCIDEQACNYNIEATEIGPCDYLIVNIQEQVVFYNNQFTPLLIATNNAINPTISWYMSDQEILLETNDSLFVNQDALFIVNIYDESQNCFGIDSFEVRDFNLSDSYKNSISVYPNPSNDKVYIDFSNFQSKMILELIDLSGKVFWSKEVGLDNQNSFHINVKQFPSQACFLNIQMINNRQLSYPLLINTK